MRCEYTLLRDGVAVFHPPAMLHALHPAQHPLYLVKLKPVIEKFKEAVPDAKMDAKLFGQSLAGMLQLMEDALGKNVRPTLVHHKTLIHLIHRPTPSLKSSPSCPCRCFATTAQRARCSSSPRRFGHTCRPAHRESASLSRCPSTAERYGWHARRRG